MYHIALTAVNGYFTDLQSYASLVGAPDKNVRESVAQNCASIPYFSGPNTEDFLESVRRRRGYICTPMR